MQPDLKLKRKKETGFTLVELAVVMIIIGLLIGGVLKGQELINNAQVNATVAQVKGIQAGLNTFKDLYLALPGDITNPVARIPNCVGACAQAGNGDGRINTVAITAAQALAAGNENSGVWSHMAQADLMAGINPNGGLQWGQALPTADVGGGIVIAFAQNAPAGAVGPMRGGHYLALRGGTPGAAVAGAGQASITPSQASRIDRKLDDGQAATGSVIADNSGGTCTVAAAGVQIYNEALDDLSCITYIRMN